MRTTRLLNLFFLIAFLLAGGFAGSDAFKRYQTLEATRGAEAEALAQLAELEAKTGSKRKSLSQMKQDPGYVERMIRQKLNYARPEEIVFKFDFDES